MKEFSRETEQIMNERFGKGASLGYFRKKENCVIAEKLNKAFSEWINNGHTDFNDENTIILRVELTDGMLLSHGTRYEF